MSATVTSNVTSGFFDSIEGDQRLYTADEFSSIFDGLISDGIYENYPGGTRTVNNQTVKIPPFEVTKVVSGNDLVVTIGPGRAWFHHVWVLNATSTVTLSAAHGTLPRIDCIYLRVNKSSRSCALACEEGTPSSDPTGSFPSDDNNNGIYYYPIAFIRVPKAAASSSALVVTSAIGNSNPPANGKTPFVRAIVDPSMTLEEYVQSYISQVNQWKTDVQELITGTPSLEFVAEVQDLKDRVDGLSDATGAEGLSGQINNINSNLQKLETNKVNPAVTNISTLMSYINSGFKYYNTNAGDINNPKETLCRMFYDSTTKKGVKGTKPVGMGNQWTVYTMNTSSSATYNVQIAIGFSYKIALRRKNGKPSWDQWKYLTFT